MGGWIEHICHPFNFSLDSWLVKEVVILLPDASHINLVLYMSSIHCWLPGLNVSLDWLPGHPHSSLHEQGCLFWGAPHILSLTPSGSLGHNQPLNWMEHHTFLPWRPWNLTYMDPSNSCASSACCPAKGKSLVGVCKFQLGKAPAMSSAVAMASIWNRN